MAALLLLLTVATVPGGRPSLAGAQTPAPAPAAPAPGAPAPEPVARELQQALATATQRFQAMDSVGVLANVSDRYRNGPFTKTSVREHLLTMFALYDTVRARVRVDDVRMVDGRAWVYSSGEITGRLRGIGAWTTVLSWEREPEVAQREGAAWKLIGPGA
ncbi:MAG TPA: hypothetical protein VIA61_08280 [Methylomirabilota bacterium]